MRNLIFLTLFLYANNILAQYIDGVLAINYYFPKDGTSSEIKVDNHLAISFIPKQPKKDEIDGFLSKSKINIIESNGMEVIKEISLINLIKSRNSNLNQVYNDLINERGLKITPLLPILKVDDVISLILYFNDKKGKKYTFKVKDNPPSIDKDILTKIDSTFQSKMDKIDSTLKSLKDGQENNLNRFNSKTSEIEEWKKGIESKLKFEKKSKKEKKKLKETFNNAINLISTFNFDDCGGCTERVGNLIYDFRCKRLYEVITNGSEKAYKLITNLNEIAIKSKELLELKVININRYLYNADAIIEDSTYGSNPPPTFDYFFGGTSELYLNNINDERIEMNGHDAKQNSQEFLNMMEAIRKYRELENKLINRQISAYLYCIDDEIKCCPDDLNKFTAYSSALQEVNMGLLKYEAKNFAKHPSSDKLRNEISQEMKKLEDCNLKKTDGHSKIEKMEKDKATANAENKKAIEAEIIKIQSSYCKETDSGTSKNKIKELEETLTQRIQFDGIKASFPTHVELRKLFIFAKNVNKDHFIFKLPPIYPNGDKLSISLKFTPRDVDTNLVKHFELMPLYDEQIPLLFTIKNKMLFSFSSGPFFAFGRNLSIPSYGFKQIPASGTVIGADARYRLDATGDGPLPVGLGAYANVGRKVYKNFGLAGTIGVGYTFNQDTPLPGFMGGLTGSFGEDQRINLTAGAAFIQVRELKRDLYLGNVYEAIPTLEYNKPMRLGLFLSVSYSILTSAVSKSASSKSK